MQNQNRSKQAVSSVKDKSNAIPAVLFSFNELIAYSNRASEIASLCAQDLDDDIFDNLMQELDSIIQILEKAKVLAKIRESGFILLNGEK